jgi:hypothetical protein
MRRLPYGVWDVDECRYDSGIGQPSGLMGSNPPSDTPATCKNSKAPEAILPPGLSFPQDFPRQLSEITLPTISAASDAALSSGWPYTSAVIAMLACPS